MHAIPKANVNQSMMSQEMKKEWSDFISAYTYPIYSSRVKLPFNYNKFYNKKLIYNGIGKIDDYFAKKVLNLINSSALIWLHVNQQLAEILCEMAGLRRNLLEKQDDLNYYKDILINSCLNRFQSLLDKSTYLAFNESPPKVQTEEGSVAEYQTSSSPQTLALPASFNPKLRFIISSSPRPIAISSTNNTFLILYKEGGLPLLYNKPKNIYLFLEGDGITDICYSIESACFSQDNQYVAITTITAPNSPILDTPHIWVWSAKSGKRLYLASIHNHDKIKYISNDTIVLENPSRVSSMLKISPISNWPTSRDFINLPAFHPSTATIHDQL